MRIALFSDIHGNLPALEVVLAAVDEERPDALWCLGDTVGYGPWPNECCDTVRERADLCLVGNHDLVVLGTLDVADFNNEAAAAAEWTRETLRDDARDWLAGLEPTAEAEGVQLFHGSPRDPVWEYVLTDEAAAAAFALSSAPLVLVGHSHVALAVRLADGQPAGGLVGGGTDFDLGDERWLLNPGSVGQPRDGDPRAAYVLLDLGAGTAAFRRLEYPVERTQAEIRRAALPETLAQRLAFGV